MLGGKIFYKNEKDEEDIKQKILFSHYSLYILLLYPDPANVANQEDKNLVNTSGPPIIVCLVHSLFPI